MKDTKKIVIFDGICGLCNKSVDILIWLDTKKHFHYTSLQGEFVKTLNLEPSIDSIIFYDDGIVYYKSTAILKILHSLSGMWTLANLFYIIPKVVRDFIYDVIAKYRYKIFGKMKRCRMPKVEEQELFID